MARENDLIAEISSLSMKIAILEERIQGNGQALNLQAKEYERRLADLNHAHAQAESKNQTYLPREVFEQTSKDWQAWRRGVDEGIALAKGGRATLLGALGIVLALSSLLANFLTRLIGQ